MLEGDELLAKIYRFKKRYPSKKPIRASGRIFHTKEIFLVHRAMVMELTMDPDQTLVLGVMVGVR